MKRLNFTLITCGLLYLGTGQAQSSSLSTGSDAIGAGGSVAYSVGQVFYHQNQSTTGSITEGVQQSYTITEITGIATVAFPLSVSVYPNPTHSFVTLDIENTDYKNLSFLLFDADGKILDTGLLIRNKTDINLAGYSYSIYFLKVTMGSQDIKTFKIIKSN